MNKIITFTLGGINFEYDEEKNNRNIQKHGISFKQAARVFFDYDRIELYDEEHSIDEDRYDTIGDLSAGNTTIGNISHFSENMNDILFVVYTERIHQNRNGTTIGVTQLISARFATNFERGLYYGKYE